MLLIGHASQPKFDLLQHTSKINAIRHSEFAFIQQCEGVLLEMQEEEDSREGLLRGLCCLTEILANP